MVMMKLLLYFYILTNLLDFVEVVNTCDAGVFVNIGVAKDILLSNDYLPTNKLAWPKVGDKVPCILKVKHDQLVARIINKEDLKRKRNPAGCRRHRIKLWTHGRVTL